MIIPKTTRTRVILVLTMLFLLLATWTCSSKADNSKLPQAIAGETLSEVVRGSDATKIINDMHGKSLGTDEYVIGYYGPKENKNILYLSIFPDEQSAKQDFMDMSMKMSRGTPVFSPLKVMNKGDKVQFTTLGMGKAHFIFRDNETLIWWQGDTTNFDQAITDLDAFQW
ncbi:MAG: hypothetical protein K9N11_10490 [Lentisphaeria bacterium]|nr:hypothetical protein [Candidatus Neomarinimicrobiota bacterium]MCF7843260.1 hypothetical protein [Lentisphaeria bacterium]